MEWLGIDFSREALQAWIQQQWEWVVPRAGRSLVVLAVALAGYFLARLVLSRIQRHFTSRTRSQIDDHLLLFLRRVTSISIVLFALWRLTDIWSLPTGQRIVSAVWLVALALPASAFVADMLGMLEERIAPRTHTTLDDTALPLVNRVVRFLIIGIAAAMALHQLGVNISPLLAGAGVAGVAISLAAKDTLSNLIAGLLLILDRPFQVGDRIELWTAPRETGTWGDVVEIGLRATKIRNPDNLIFVIPNNEIMRRDIVNYTASGDQIRVRIPIDIAYDADPELAKEIILAVASETRGVDLERPPRVIIRRFGESGVGLELRVWITNARDRRAVADAITDRVKTQFDQRGVEIPYPKRDLYIKSAPADLGLETTGGSSTKSIGTSGSGPRLRESRQADEAPHSPAATTRHEDGRSQAGAGEQHTPKEND